MCPLCPPCSLFPHGDGSLSFDDLLRAFKVTKVQRQAGATGTTGAGYSSSPPAASAGYASTTVAYGGGAGAAGAGYGGGASAAGTGAGYGSGTVAPPAGSWVLEEFQDGRGNHFLLDKDTKVR